MLDHVTRLLQGVQEAVLGGSSGAPRFTVLVAVSGGSNASAIVDILPALASGEYEVHLLHVRRPGAPGGGPVLDAATARIRTASAIRRREVVSQDVRGALVAASREADLLVLGASLGPRPVSNAVALDLAKRSACPVVVVREGAQTYVPRTERKALVVGERSLSARLGVNRALRWGVAGSGAVDVLLGKSEDPFAQLERAPAPLAPDPAYSGVREIEDPLDDKRVLAELQTGKHDLLVIAADPQRIEGSRRWIDNVVVGTDRPVVCAFAGRKGPRTKTKVPSTAATT